MEWPSLYPPYTPGSPTIPLPRRPDERELDDSFPDDPGAYDSFNPSGTAASPAYSWNNGVFQWFLQSADYSQEAQSQWDGEGGTLIISRSARYFDFPCAPEFVICGAAAKLVYSPMLIGDFPCLWPPNPPFGYWQLVENPLDAFAETPWQYWTEFGASYPCDYQTRWEINAGWDLRFYRDNSIGALSPIPPIVFMLLGRLLKRKRRK
jgi:hypothetical protein